MIDEVSTSRELAGLLRGEPPPTSVEWDRVVSLARRHGVSPLLYWRLGREARNALVPPGIWETLQNDYYTAVVQGMLRDQEVGRVLAAFNEAGVPVLLLKGVALAHTVYPDPILRTMGDVDIVVREMQVEQGSETLEKLGYEYQPEPPQRFNPFNTAFTGERSFLRRTDRSSMLVELHRVFSTIELVRRTMALDLETLWSRAASLEIGTATAFLLSPEDQLMHVCLHISMHGFAHLRGYVDIVHIVGAAQIDWNVFVERVRQGRLRVTSYFPLWWAERAWDVPVPAWVLQMCKPDPLRIKMGHWMVVSAVKRRLDAGHAWNHVAQILVVDRRRDLVRALLWLFFPGPAWLRERYQLRTLWQAWVWTIAHPLVVLWEGLCSMRALIKRTVRG
jgi:hypothetical protein